MVLIFTPYIAWACNAALLLSFCTCHNYRSPQPVDFIVLRSPRSGSKWRRKIKLTLVQLENGRQNGVCCMCPFMHAIKQIWWSEWSVKSCVCVSRCDSRTNRRDATEYRESDAWWPDEVGGWRWQSGVPWRFWRNTGVHFVTITVIIIRIQIRVGKTARFF